VKGFNIKEIEKRGKEGRKEGRTAKNINYR
jgi:hypothetical protein